MDQITDIQFPGCHTPMIRMVGVDQHQIDHENSTRCFGIVLDAGEFKDRKSYTIQDYLTRWFMKKK